MDGSSKKLDLDFVGQFAKLSEPKSKSLLKRLSSAIEYTPPISDSLKKQFDDFVEFPWKRGYIDDDIIRVYVRKSKRLIWNRTVTCVDIASVNIADPAYQGKGYFRGFVRYVEMVVGASSDYQAVHVENVHNAILAINLLKHDYQYVREEEEPPSFVKFPHVNFDA